MVMLDGTAYHAIKQVHHLLQNGEEYVDILNHHDGDSLDDMEHKEDARDDLLSACNTMLDLLGPIGEEETSDGALIESKKNHNNKSVVVKDEKKAPKKKKRRSILFGASMGAAVAFWVFSGNFLFTTLFTLMTALGQLEYYRMVMRVGIYPARKISVVGACAMFITVSSKTLFLTLLKSSYASCLCLFFIIGISCSRIASNLPAIVWNIRNDLVFDHEA